MKKRIFAILLVLVTVSGILCSCAKKETAVTGGSSNSSALKINEVCFINQNAVATSSGRYLSYVELYNSSSTEESVSNLYLSDDENDLQKYRVPFTKVAPGGYLLVFLSESFSTDEKNKDNVSGFSVDINKENKIILTKGTKVKIDSVDVPVLSENEAYSRVTDGAVDFESLCPTPEKSNNDAGKYSEVSAIEFSRDSGFYSSAFTLDIKAPEGCTVYYTTDGSMPNAESEKLGSSLKITDASKNDNVFCAKENTLINEEGKAGEYIPSYKVDKSTVLRVAAQDSKGNFGRVFTKEYFVGFSSKSGYADYNIVSIVSDESNLFSEESGILTLGKLFNDAVAGNTEEKLKGTVISNCNAKGTQWHKNAFITFYKAGGEVIKSGEFSIAPYGDSNAEYSQKQFEIFSKTEYGSKEDFSKLIDSSDKAINELTFIAGSSVSGRRFHDLIIRELVSDSSYFVADAVQVTVFINGEYWGVYNMSERLGTQMIANRTGLKQSEIALCSGSEAIDCDSSLASVYSDVINYAATTDFTNSDKYEILKRKIDIPTFIDYCADSIYLQAGSFFYGALPMWSSTSTASGDKYASGKWYPVCEKETGALLRNYNMNKNGMINPFETLESANGAGAKMLRNMLRNDEFRAEFEKKLRSVSKERFSTANAQRVYSEYLPKGAVPYEKTYTRFINKKLDKGAFNFGINEISSYFKQRQGFVIECLDEELKKY